MSAIVVAGTDTNVGKTVFAAALVDALGAAYWKPVQAGLDGETDSEVVARLAGLGPGRILPEAFRLRTPVSPHLAARLDGLAIVPEKLDPPHASRPLVIETAGGVMTPLTLQATNADLLARWRLPVVVVARTRLGAINHSLLTLETLRRRGAPVLGVAFVGEEDAEAQSAIARMGETRVLGRLPQLAPLTRESLAAAFAAGFDKRDFL
jgi:dethiobiotin synthetase